jgi:hypothetical protein
MKGRRFDGRLRRLSRFLAIGLRWHDSAGHSHESGVNSQTSLPREPQCEQALHPRGISCILRLRKAEAVSQGKAL